MGSNRENLINQVISSNGGSLTFGSLADLVLTDAPSQSQNGVTITGPGSYVNTSNNTDNINDLIVAIYHADNQISTGSGNDSVYAFYGNDTVYGGAGDDYMMAEVISIFYLAAKEMTTFSEVAAATRCTVALEMM